MELRGLELHADSALTGENVELPERTCDQLEFAKGQRREADEPGAPAGPHSQREQTLGPTVRDAVGGAHTTGRKSGLPRCCYLTTPAYDSKRVVLIASKGGDDRNPDWYRNLQARPEAFLVLNGQRHAVHARTASAEEKAELWPKIVASYKGYAGYQQRTDRDIPVVICELQN